MNRSNYKPSYSSAMRRSRKKKSKYSPLYLLFYFLFLYLFYEIILRSVVIDIFWGRGLFFIFLFALPTALLSYIICTLFKPKVNRPVALILSCILFLVYSAQLVYHHIFGKLFIMKSVEGAGQVLEFWKVTLTAIWQLSLILILMFLPILLYILFSKKYFSFVRLHWQLSAAGAGAVILLHAFCLFIMLLGGKSVLSPYDIYNESSYSLDDRVALIGLLQGMRKDVQINLLGMSDNDLVIEPVDSEIDLSSETLTEDGSETDSETTDSETETEPDSVLDTSPNVINIDFDSLIASETDDTIKTMHQYFSSVIPTNKNEYTGTCKGYNLIHITAEGFSDFVIDKDRTPTLYKMVNEGFNFTNFYCPIWGVSTSDGEYANCVGLIPKAGVWSLYQSADNNLYYCFGNQFRRLGYLTLAFHDHTYSYYHRDVSHPNMGYDYYGLGNGVDVRETWPESDLEMIQKTSSKFIDTGDPFAIYYMTVSGHLNYTFTGNFQSYAHRDVVADLPYSDNVRAYLACNYELELAMKQLLEYLNEAGIAEKTVIVISPDHYPYGLTNEEISELLGHDVEPNFELYKSRLIIYRQGMTPVTVNKLCSSLDIIPTVSNLFGTEYDSRLLMGQDILSDSSPLVIFNNRSWITDKMSYNSQTGEYKNLTAETLPDSYSDNINNIVKNKFSFSTAILDNDYYGVLFGDD